MEILINANNDTHNKYSLKFKRFTSVSLKFLFTEYNTRKLVHNKALENILYYIHISSNFKGKKEKK